MSQANVNVGTAPGAGNGDTLYNAFTKINTNFTELYSTITSSGTTYANIAPSVDSSASGSGLTLNITKYANIYGVSVNLPGTDYALGETVRVWGNVVGGSYTTHDLVVEVGTLANSSIGSVGTVTFTGTPSRPVLTVAGRTGDVVLTTNDIIGLRSTFSSNADIQSVVDAKISANISSLIGTAPGVLDTLGEIADALNDDANVYNTLATSITTGNTNLKGYTDNLVTTANVNMKGYVDAEITAIGAHYGNADVLAYLNDNSYATETYVTTANTNVVGYVDGQVTTLNSAITTANTNVVGYVDGQVTTLNSAITTANTNVVGYVDGQVTTLNSAITTANTNVVGYVDSAVSTANVNLKGYVDGEIATVTAGHYSNTEVLAYLTDNSYATETYVTTANTNVVGYVDGQVTTLNSSITTANTNVVGYVDSAVSTANVNLKGYTDNQFTTGNTNVVGYVDSAVTTANVNLKGYVDSEISDTVGATGSSIAEANTNMRGYVDGQVTTLNSSITTANTNVVGYVDSAVSTANVNLKGYVDNELTSYATTSALTTANTNVVGYVDSAVSTANVNLKGYVDGEIAGLVDSAPATLDTLNEIAAALGDDPNLATTLTNTITTANVNMKGYVDGQISGISSYTDSDVADYLPTYNGNIGGLVTSGPTMEYFGNLTAGASQGNLVITQSNAGHKININGNVEIINGNLAVQSAGSNSRIVLSTENPGGNLRIGLPDNGGGFVAYSAGAGIALGNVQIYADDGDSPNYLYINNYGKTTQHIGNIEILDGTLNSHTIPSGTGTIALTSDVTTANVNLKGYVDNEISGLSLGNIATITLDGNVSNVLAGDGTFITAGSGGSGLADVVDDTTPQLGGNLDLNGSYITGTGNIAITGNIIGDNRVTGSLTVDDSIAVENNVTLNGGTIQIEGQTGNISATNINLSGDLDILGDVNSALTVQSNDLTVNNANVVVVGYVVGDTVTTSSGGVTITDADVILGGNVIATQNIIGGTLTSSGNIDATTGSITGASIFSLSDVVGSNFYGANFYGGNVTVADATIIFEGATADAFETTLAVTDPTADRTITFPDATGTVALTSDVTTANVNLKGYVDSLSHYEDSDVNTLLASWGSNTLSTTGNVTVGDAIVNSGVKEAYGALSSATGTVTHDCSNGHVFYHTSISSDFTANFTNLQLDTGYVTTLTLVLSQGATAYIASAVQIEGVAQTIKWQGNVTPTGTDNGVDAMSFSVINSSGTYTVLGQLVDFGG